MKKIVLLLIVLFSVTVACQPAATPTLAPTPVPPTAIPPTSTPFPTTTATLPPTPTPIPRPTGNLVFSQDKWQCEKSSYLFGREVDPSDTIMHEAVHLGIEEVIIQKYSLDQRVKERIVDKFMFDHFLALVPGYQMQSVGDPSIDKYLSGETAWNNLPERIKDFESGK